MSAAGSPDLDFPDDLNIAARLLGFDDEQAGRPAFLYRDRQVDYGTVLDAARRWAGVLERLGVVPEQRVFLALPDAPSFPACFLGTIWYGAVAVPVNPYLAGDAYRFFLEDSRAPVAAVAPWLVDDVLALPGLSRLRHLVVFADSGDADDPAAGDSGGAGNGGWRAARDAPGTPGVHDGRALMDAAQPVNVPASTHRDEPAFWLYTSGSTGRPKAAVHLHHDMWVAAECWGERTLGLNGHEVHLSASKLFFAYGLGNSLHCPLWSGGRTVLMPEKPDSELVLRAIADHGVTHFYAVPSFYNAMLASEAFERCRAAGDLDSLEVCVSAGEALPESVCRRWMERAGAPVLDGIGSTELLHIFISNRVDDVRPGSSGKPIPGYRARVVAEDGSDAAVDEIGDLWVEGDSACGWYWNRHEATKQAVRGAWFVTGDKYRRDADGYYWYAGRADDMFKVHGRWVSPTEVESALLEHPAVQEAAVVAGQDREGLACGVAWIVVPADVEAGEGLAAELREHASARLSRYCVPARVRFREELPRTATGKVQRYRLRES